MSILPSFDAYTPREIAQRVQDVCLLKSHMTFLQLAMLGILAGGFIGLGSLYYVIVASDPQLGFAAQRVLGGVVFSLGLLLVVVAGAELLPATICWRWPGPTAACRRRMCSTTGWWCARRISSAQRRSRRWCFCPGTPT